METTKKMLKKEDYAQIALKFKDEAKAVFEARRALLNAKWNLAGSIYEEAQKYDDSYPVVATLCSLVEALHGREVVDLNESLNGMIWELEQEIKK